LARTQGDLVKSVMATDLQSGKHSFEIDRNGISGSGPMLVRLKAKDGEMVRTMIMGD
jgi:hypothetical protein